MSYCNHAILFRHYLVADNNILQSASAEGSKLYKFQWVTMLNIFESIYALSPETVNSWTFLACMQNAIWDFWNDFWKRKFYIYISQGVMVENQWNFGYGLQIKSRIKLVIK